MLLNADLSRSLNVLKEKNKSRLIGVSKVAWGVGGGECVGQRDLEKATERLHSCGFYNKMSQELHWRLSK